MNLLGEGFIHTGAMNLVFEEERKNKGGGYSHPLTDTLYLVAAHLSTHEESIRDSVAIGLLNVFSHYKQAQEHNSDVRFITEYKVSSPDKQRLVENNLIQQHGEPARRKLESLKKLKEIPEEVILEEHPWQRILEVIPNAEKYLRAVKHHWEGASTESTNTVATSKDGLMGIAFANRESKKSLGEYDESKHISRIHDIAQLTLDGLEKVSTVPVSENRKEILQSLKILKKEAAQLVPLEESINAIFSAYQSMKDAGSIKPDNHTFLVRTEGGEEKTVGVQLNNGTTIKGERFENLKTSYLGQCFETLEKSLSLKALNNSLFYSIEQIASYDFEASLYKKTYEDIKQSVMDHAVEGRYSYDRKRRNLYGNDFPEFSEILTAAKLGPVKTNNEKLNELPTAIDQMNYAMDNIIALHANDRAKFDRTDDIMKFLLEVRKQSFEHGPYLGKVTGENEITYSGGAIQFDYKAITRAFDKLQRKIEERSEPDPKSEDYELNKNRNWTINLQDSKDVIAVMNRVKGGLTLRYQVEYAVALNEYEHFSDEGNFIKRRDKAGSTEFTFEFSKEKIKDWVKDCAEKYGYQTVNTDMTGYEANIAKEHEIQKQAAEKLFRISNELTYRFKECPYGKDMDVSIDLSRRIIIKNASPEIINAYEDDAKQMEQKDDLAELGEKMHDITDKMNGLNIEMLKQARPKTNTDGKTCNFKLAGRMQCSSVKEKEVQGAFNKLKETISSLMPGVDIGDKVAKRQFIEVNNFPADKFKELQELLLQPRVSPELQK